MTVIHVVLFQFSSSASEETVKDVCDRMLGLKQTCLHPTSQKPYVVESSGGKDNSPEGHQGGLTHGFVVQFANEEDRDYYALRDPVHIAFAKSLAGIVEKVTVLDYTVGKF